MAEGQFVQRGANFDFCVKNISKLVNYWTPRVMIQDIPWNYQIVKTNFNNEEWLSIYLHSKKDDKSRDWGIAAASSIELISSRGKINNFQQLVAPYFFDYTGLGYGNCNLIKWAELFDKEKGYIKNDTINFNIRLELLNQYAENASKLIIDSNERYKDCSQATFRLTINNIDNLMAVRTSEFVLQNSRWDLTTFKYSSALGIRVSHKDDQGAHNVKIDVRMKSPKADVQDIEKTKTAQVKTFHCVHLMEIISWDELFKPENGFVANNSISFEVKIQVDAVESATPKAKKRRTSNTPETESNTLTLECAVCLENIKNQQVSSTECGHLFCSECIKKVVETRKSCPSCNTKLTINKLRRLYLPIAKKDLVP